jgi:hypothetical protein
MKHIGCGLATLPSHIHTPGMSHAPSPLLRVRAHVSPSFIFLPYVRWHHRPEKPPLSQAQYTALFPDTHVALRPRLPFSGLRVRRLRHARCKTRAALRLRSHATLTGPDLRLDWRVCGRMGHVLLSFLSSLSIPNPCLLCSISLHLPLPSPTPFDPDLLATAQARPYARALPTPMPIPVQIDSTRERVLFSLTPSLLHHFPCSLPFPISSFRPPSFLPSPSRRSPLLTPPMCRPTNPGAR